MTSTTLARNGFVVVKDPAAPRNEDAVENIVRVPGYRHPPEPEAGGDGRPALAVFCFEAPDGCVGGHVARLAPALARRGAPVHIFARHEFPPAEGVTAHAVGECDGADILDRVEQFTNRAVHAFEQQFPAGGRPVALMGFEWSAAPALAVLREARGLRALQSLHSVERQRSDVTGDVARKIDEIERRALAESETVLTHDPAAAEIAKYWVPEVADKIVGAHTPFPAGRFEGKLDPGAVKARFQVGPVDPTVVCVGDLDERYGQDLLVKAMPGILKNHKQVRLIVVGEGQLYWPLRVYARYLLLEHAVRLPGSVEGQALAELIAAADVVVVPSREQTPWWPVLAGWAAGSPVVATHNAAPGLVSHEQDAVLCYPSENSLVWGVERVLFDADLRATMARNGRERLEERFGWNMAAEQVEQAIAAMAAV